MADIGKFLKYVDEDNCPTFRQALKLENVQNFMTQLENKYNIGPCGRLNKCLAIAGLLGYLMVSDSTGKDDYF